MHLPILGQPQGVIRGFFRLKFESPAPSRVGGRKMRRNKDGAHPNHRWSVSNAQSPRSMNYNEGSTSEIPTRCPGYRSWPASSYVRRSRPEFLLRSLLANTISSPNPHLSISHLQICRLLRPLYFANPPPASSLVHLGARGGNRTPTPCGTRF
jgi:hypothetical protein